MRAEGHRGDPAVIQAAVMAPLGLRADQCQGREGLELDLRVMSICCAPFCGSEASPAELRVSA